MKCTLCSGEILKSGTVRPNVATFECGHEYHLTCAIAYCKSRYTEACPTCSKTQETSSSINLGKERIHSIESLVQARRKHREMPEKAKSAFSWFSTESSLKQLVSSGTSLNTLRIKGYLPEDFIENQISWSSLASVYTVDALLDFGCKWHHMIMMGFSPEDFKLMSWQQMYDTLKIRASDMLKTSINIRQLGELKFSVQQIKQLGFTWKDFMQMDGNVKTMRDITSNLSDLRTYFNPSQAQWEQAGFTRERINLYKWSTDEFTPVRQTRKLNLNTIKTLDF